MEIPRFSIVIPCYNEAENVPKLVERVHEFAARGDFELILVDNGSTDNTAEVLDDLRTKAKNGFVRVLRIARNEGYGHGIHSGLRTAMGEVLAFTHADLQTPPEDVFRAFDLVAQRAADPRTEVIKGSRRNRSQREAFFTRWLARVAKVLLGVKLEDINGQPKVFDRALLALLTWPPTDFSYDLYVLYRARVTGRSIMTFDVEFGERRHGESKWAAGLRPKMRTIFGYMVSIARMAWHHRAEKDNPVGQVLRFLATGVLTNVVNYVSFFALLRLLDIHYVLSSAGGFGAGFILGFVVNRTYTFGIRGPDAIRQLFRFLFLNLLSLAANLLTILVAVDVMGFIPEIGQIAAIAVSTTLNFSGSKFWVFRRRSER